MNSNQMLVYFYRHTVCFNVIILLKLRLIIFLITYKDLLIIIPLVILYLLICLVNLTLSITLLSPNDFVQLVFFGRVHSWFMYHLYYIYYYSITMYLLLSSPCSSYSWCSPRFGTLKAIASFFSLFLYYRLCIFFLNLLRSLLSLCR